MHPQSNTSHLSQAPSGEKQRKAFNGEDPINPEDSLNLKDSTVGITKIMRIIKVTEHQLAKEWSDIIIN